MAEQIIVWTGIALIGVWVIAMLVTQIKYLIASFQASVGLTILSFIIPFVGLYVLIKFWEDLRRPFMNQLVVAIGGFVLLFGGGMALKAAGLLPDNPGLPDIAMSRDSGLPSGPPPAAPPENQEVQELPPAQPATTADLDPGQPAPEQPLSSTPLPATPAPSWGQELAVRDAATITIPNGWVEMGWTLPNLAVAMGNQERGEFVTVQVISKEAHPSFNDFQTAVLEELLQDVIEGQAPTQSRPLPVNGLDAVTYAMGGDSRLEGQAGYPMSARISCIDGKGHRYYIVQWRVATWDQQSVREFDRLLHSFMEKEG